MRTSYLGKAKTTGPPRSLRLPCLLLYYSTRALSLSTLLSADSRHMLVPSARFANRTSTSRVESTARPVPIPRGCVHYAVSFAFLSSGSPASAEAFKIWTQSADGLLALRGGPIECLIAGKMIMDTKDHKQSQA